MAFEEFSTILQSLANEEITAATHALGENGTWAEWTAKKCGWPILFVFETVEFGITNLGEQEMSYYLFSVNYWACRNNFFVIIVLLFLPSRGLNFAQKMGQSQYGPSWSPPICFLSKPVRSLWSGQSCYVWDTWPKTSLLNLCLGDTWPQTFLLNLHLGRKLPTCRARLLTLLPEVGKTSLSFRPTSFSSSS